jgi:hypothetical protein
VSAVASGLPVEDIHPEDHADGVLYLPYGVELQPGQPGLGRAGLQHGGVRVGEVMRRLCEQAAGDAGKECS